MGAWSWEVLPVLPGMGLKRGASQAATQRTIGQCKTRPGCHREPEFAYDHFIKHEWESNVLNPSVYPDDLILNISESPV